MLQVQLSTNEVDPNSKEDIESELAPSSLLFGIHSEVENNLRNIFWNLSTSHKKLNENSHESSQLEFNSDSIRMFSSGGLFVLKGRTKHFNKGILIEVHPFEVSLNDAENVETVEVINDNEFKEVLRNQKQLTIRASGFDANKSPISALSLTFITGMNRISIRITIQSVSILQLIFSSQLILSSIASFYNR
jgi:hypothetical protein